MQTLKIVARTFDITDNGRIITDNCSSPDRIEHDMTLLGGKMAGICYMPDDYLSEGIQNEEKSLKRAAGNKKSGHYSVFEHGSISFILETNKMMAMILNSLGVYSTSEKSGRYTVMKASSELEQKLYDKWKSIFKHIISGYYNVGSYESGDIVESLPKCVDMDEKSIEKLAQENARYMLSIFTPTTMAYTVSYKQALMIPQWLNNLADISESKYKTTTDTMFYHQLYLDCKVLAGLISNAIKANSDELVLHDHKSQSIRFIQFGELPKEVISDSYTLRYKASLACVAQLQRHRSIRYRINIDNIINNPIYVPDIILGTPYEKIWRNDQQLLKDNGIVTQAISVDVAEQGIVEDFYLKCLERLCSRAQLEIQNNTIESLYKFSENHRNLSDDNTLLITRFLKFNDDDKTYEAVPRCCNERYTCKEPCKYGKDGLNRNI